MYSDIEYLNEFVYDSKLQDLGVFSKQYFNSILYSLYKSNPDKLICFTFGDFNKLSQINKQYSHQAGDTAVKESLKSIKDSLPKNTIIARIAGDEFCFLTPDAHKYDMDKIFDTVNPILQNNKEKNYGLTITTSSVDSSFYPEFDDMYFHTELDVTRKKKINDKNKFKSYDELLSDTIYHGLSNYFSYYRLEQDSLPKDYYSLLKHSIIDIVVHNLESPDKNMLFFMERLNSTLPETDFEEQHLTIQPELASQIHNYITNKENEKVPDSIKFNKLFKFLITDPLTGECSKKFFDTSVLPLFEENNNNRISVRLFDLAHLKLSNDIIGHNKTDEKICELYKKLVSQIKSENSHSKYFASTGNCGLLLIENADSAISDNRINKFMQNAMLNQRILNLITSSRTCNSSEISQTISQLQKDCKIQKEQYKLNKISSKETILPLQLSLNDSINCYIKNSDNPYSMKNKQKFVIKIFKTLSQVIYEQFPSQDANIFTEER